MPVQASEIAQTLLAAMPVSRIDFAHRVGFHPQGWQVAALESESDRMIFNVTRQGGKSSTAAVIALHETATVSESLVLIAARDESKSKEMLRKIRRFCSGLSHRLIAESKTAVEFANGSRILALCGAEGAARGFSAASVVIIDEGARVSIELLDAISPTLAVKEGRLIVLSTPFGKRGFFYDLWRGDNSWEKYMALCTECPWLSPRFLEGERERMTEAQFGQEYLCEFRETEESAFSYSDIEAAFQESVLEWSL